MGKNTNFVSHKKSKQKNQDGSPKLPVASALVEGEIAINFGKDVETLSIKNESGDVVTFSSDNYYTEQKLGSAFTGSNSATTVTDVLNSLEVGEEVEVNSGDTPTGDTIELWIDESIEPVTVEVYTKAETNALLAEKADEATTLNGYGITDAYTKTEVNTMMTTATEQSTINATDYVVLKDTDGVNRKISKANMMSAVKDTLADLLRNNDLGTDVTNVPALNASAFGSATIANLASVLGGVGVLINKGEYGYYDIMDFDDLTETGYYFVATNKTLASNHSNVPRTDMDTRAYVFTLKGNSQNAYVFQLFLDASVPCIYYRGNASGSWTRVQPMS